MAVEPATCRVCGAQPRQGARFCDSCGSPLTENELPAEYKQVTVLFADVVRSMDLAAALGPERLREIMTGLVNRATAVVTRYGGTVDKFTGDGIMAIFGAPAALEDHAFRACLAALDLQKEAAELAAEIEKADRLQFQLRVGLNSGQVITGDITSSPTSYTAVGEQVGLAQRMESVAPPGGVMLSDSTASLVEGTVDLADPELVHIKGVQTPITARRLLGSSGGLRRRRTTETTLVGRTWELASIAGMLDEALGGAGCVVGLVGPAGIGKSRIVREVTSRAAQLGVDVITAACESHTSDLPFHAAAALLTAALDITGMAKAAARAQVRDRVPGAAAGDLLLVDDLLGIADPGVEAQAIEADARRRRLTGLLDTALMTRQRPTVFVIEDAHWIDEPSEALLTSFLEVAPQTPSVVLVTYRPEYRGALANVQGAQTITLRPLSNTQTSALTSALLGRHSSVRALVDHIADRAAGNPFFAEEIVRDLAERGVLEGVAAKYTCCADLTDIRVPATLQAAIAARIDRLGAAAKRTLAAASVIGSRFNSDLLEGVGVTPAFGELVDAELVTRVQFTARQDYAFKHPLIRTVAYESQLKSDRTELHRRLAAVIQTRSCGDDKAAEIAEHFEAAGDLRTAFEWHMRAGQWLTNRDIAAARTSWQRARQVADRLPAGTDQLTMRIAPRTLLCASAYRGGGRVDDTGFEELRDLCEQAEDRRSLAIAMAGLPATMTLLNRHRDAADLAAEQEQLVESIGDPVLTVGLLHGAITGRIHAGEVVAAARTAQRVIDTAAGDPTMGELLIGSPLAQATMLRGFARCVLGQTGWRDDFADAVALASGSDPVTRVIVASYPIGMLHVNGVFVADDAFLAAAQDAFKTAEQSGDDFTLSMAGFAYGAASMARGDADTAFGAQVLEDALDLCVAQQNELGQIPPAVALASHRAKFGNVDGAIRMSRTVVDTTFGTGEMILRGPATAALVEALLQRGTDDDIRAARALVERLAAVPTDPGFVLFDLPLLRLRALLARSDGDEPGYRDLRDRYCVMANALGFQGHMAIADAMD